MVKSLDSCIVLAFIRREKAFELVGSLPCGGDSMANEWATCMPINYIKCCNPTLHTGEHTLLLSYSEHGSRSSPSQSLVPWLAHNQTWLHGWP